MREDSPLGLVDRRDKGVNDEENKRKKKAHNTNLENVIFVNWTHVEPVLHSKSCFHITRTNQLSNQGYQQLVAPARNHL
jgi:hypothetical protein